MIGVMGRNRFKKKPKAEKKAWAWPAFFSNWRVYVRRGSVVLVLVGALSALTWALDRPVKVISIDGSFQRVSPQQIEKAVAPFASEGFMSANLSDIQRAVETLPWVDHARIARRWPNSLRVSVTEQTAAARWGESDKYRELNRLIREMALEMPRVGYVETFDMVLGSDGNARPELYVKDRLHFSPEGYQLLRE